MKKTKILLIHGNLIQEGSRTDTNKELANLKIFYTFILTIDGIFLEEGQNKKPLATEQNRINIRDLKKIIQILSVDDREILIDISNTTIVVFDFDIHKIQDLDTRNTLRKKIIDIGLKNN